MNKFCFAIILAFITSLYSMQSSAILVSLDPSVQNINVSDSTSVDLTISELGDFVAPSLGAFLVEILFDESKISFDSVSYGSFLGDPNDFFETDIITTTAAGQVSLDEISFLFDFELDALQPSSFVLATLNFTGIAAGQSLLDFGIVELSNAEFPASTISADLETATIQVNGSATIPEPGALLLFLSGIVGIGSLRFRNIIAKNSCNS